MVKQRVAVLYGGRADEHPISCVSAAGVLNAMDRDRFDPLPIGITREGLWIVGGDDPRGWDLGGSDLPEVTVTEASRPVLLDIAEGADGFYAGDHADLDKGQSGPSRPPLVGSAAGRGQSLESLGHIDAVFPVLHGPFGEDGTVQGLLEMMGVPYIGCGVFASAVCMDKHFTKIVLQAAGIPVAPGITVDARTLAGGESIEASGDELVGLVREAGLRYPVFVKPSRAGSSFGVTKVEAENAKDLARALFEASRHDWRVLIEEGIQAREIECAVFDPVEGEGPQTAWPGEIVLDRPADDAFYDFDSKYMDAAASHVEVPAKLPEATLETVRQTAARAFRAVDGRGLSRVDCFVLPDGRVMVNEINTMPGFTPISMYPKAWEATGLSYSDLITQLITGILR
ncbi:D-alanine--D-alanine ligase family protein [Bifidobacterium xylocopae]|uniref:D-alanine--D-alanine ligase n=1 Tax=Bifidobacterium xylocopae TaxID=2493119 RepID=A0A366KDD7_9BIFI|nr:D-alanine--D-alanine ligase family protein [Bifidobacterium xylocopae]RBP99730.1 D-alanine--D-alanine ligase A [Bifidobacterium xylocopae]